MSEPSWKVLLALVVVFIVFMVFLDRILTVPPMTAPTTTTSTTVYVSDITVLDIDEFLTTTTIAVELIPPISIVADDPYDPDDPSTWPTELLVPDRCPTEEPCD